MIRSTVFFCLVWWLGLSNLQAQEVLYHEDFEGKQGLFRPVSNQFNQSSIKSGKYVWKHTGKAPQSIFSYLNRLDDRSDFSIEAQFKVSKLGSEYGLIWGGIDDTNANYFLVKGKKFSVCLVRNGQLSCEPNNKPVMKIKLENNLLRIEKRGNTVYYYCNGDLLHKAPYNSVQGKAMGISLWNDANIQVDHFTIKGTALPIPLAKDLYYAQPPQHLGAMVNTPYEEMTPVVTPNGKGIFFSRRYDPQNTGGSSDIQDVYYSQLKEDRWVTPKNIGKPINNDGPNAVFAVSPDGNTLLLMNTYTHEGKQKGMGLSLSHRTRDGWSVPEDVKMRSYYNKSFFNEYFLSNDGKVILLAVQRDDTRGGRDLYVSFNEGQNIWSSPKNLGKTINTPGTELSPFLASDGITLYFSSVGHPGFGKNDIFMSKRLDDSWQNWSAPVNLGKPINSPGTDAYYSLPASGAYAYFVSNKNGLGRNDIFRIPLPQAVKPEPVVLVHGKVLNSKTMAPIATSITYHHFDTDLEAGIARSSPSDGYYEIVLPLNQVYSFFAEKKGFYSVQQRLDLNEIDKYQEVERDLYLTPIEVGQTVQLNNVLFYRSEARLIPTSYAELNKLADMLKSNQGILIELSGHTDNVGDPNKNLVLSEERAEAVKEYLVGQGTDPDHVKCQGFGGTKPIANNNHESTRRLNRRVEFKIVNYSTP